MFISDVELAISCTAQMHCVPGRRNACWHWHAEFVGFFSILMFSLISFAPLVFIACRQWSKCMFDCVAVKVVWKTGLCRNVDWRIQHENRSWWKIKDGDWRWRATTCFFFIARINTHQCMKFQGQIKFDNVDFALDACERSKVKLHNLGFEALPATHDASDVNTNHEKSTHACTD